MPNPREHPRTPAPATRIGKTLGAILSAPRRGAPDADDAPDSPAESVEPAGHSAEPAADPAAHPAAIPAAAAGTAAPRAEQAKPAQHATSEGGADAAAGGGAVPVAQPAAPTPPAVTAAGAVADDEDARGPRASPRKKRETFLIPEELADAMRNAIVHLSGPPLYYTLAEFGEHAIRDYIGRLEREHNGGRPFPRRPRAVRQGRPLR